MLLQARDMSQRVIQMHGSKENLHFYLWCMPKIMLICHLVQCALRPIGSGGKKRKLITRVIWGSRGNIFPTNCVNYRLLKPGDGGKKCGFFCTLSDAEECSETCATASCWVEIFGRRPTERERIKSLSAKCSFECLRLDWSFFSAKSYN